MINAFKKPNPGATRHMAFFYSIHTTISAMVGSSGNASGLIRAFELPWRFCFYECNLPSTAESTENQLKKNTNEAEDGCRKKSDGQPYDSKGCGEYVFD